MRTRVLVGISSLILICTAIFHATGYSALATSVAASSLPNFFRRAVPGIWLFFSWHLIAIAIASAWVSIRGSQNARPLLAFCALVICVDSVFVFILAGIFAGTILLWIAAIFLVIATWRWPYS